MSEGYEPITAELRELMGGVEPRVDEDGVVTAKYVTPEAWGEFVRRCDAIDAIHAGLERENAELRQRVAVLDNERGNMHIGSASVTITPTLDWTGVARELRAIADTLAGDAE